MSWPRLRRFLASVIGTFAAGAALACGTDSPSAPTRAVVTVRISPSTLTLFEGQDTTLAATALDAREAPISALAMTWQVEDTAVARVHNDGAVIARRAGTTRVTATVAGVTGAAMLTVTQVPVSRLVLAPATLSLVVGETAVLVATAEDSAHATLSDRVVAYTTSDSTVATVAEDGRVRGVRVGTATIVATSEGRTASAPVTVTPVPVARVALTPSKAVLIAGHSVQLVPRTWDAGGNLLSGRVATYAGGNPGVLTVRSDGLLTAVAPGTSFAMVTVEGKRAAAEVEVIPATRRTWVRFESEYGDWAGQGETHEYSAENAFVTLTSVGARLQLLVMGLEHWRVDIALPGRLDRFVPGVYAGLPRPGSDPRESGAISVAGGGCEKPVGSVMVDSVAYSDSVLTAIDLRIDQRCDPSTSVLHTVIHWRGYEAPTPPGPVVPIPAGLWTPPAPVLPSSGNYVYLESEQGDFVGEGAHYLYTDTDAAIGIETVSLANDEGHATAGVIRGDEWWHGDFQAMAGLHQLQVGYYGNLLRYPYHDRLVGGMDWVTSRGCNALSGWFVVDAITYEGGRITALDLRFSQHCDGAAAALRGAIHWRAPAVNAASPAIAPRPRVNRGPR